MPKGRSGISYNKNGPAIEGLEEIVIDPPPLPKTKTGLDDIFLEIEALDQDSLRNAGGSLDNAKKVLSQMETDLSLVRAAREASRDTLNPPRHRQEIITAINQIKTLQFKELLRNVRLWAGITSVLFAPLVFIVLLLVLIPEQASRIKHIP